MRKVLAVAAIAGALVASCSRQGGESATHRALQLAAPSPVDRPFVLKNQSALDVKALLALLPERMRPTYETAAFESRLGATVVTGLAFPDPDGEGPRLPMTVRRLELFGVDRDAMLRISEAHRDAAAPFETVFVKVRAFDVVPEHAEGETSSVGAIEWADLRIRRGAFAPLGDARPTPAHFLNNFAMGGLYVKNWTAATGSDPESLTFKAPDLRLAGFSEGRLQGVLLKGGSWRFSMSPQTRAAFGAGFGPLLGAALNGPLGAFIFPADQDVKARSLEWRDIDLSGWMRKELEGEAIAMDARGLISLGTMRARGVDTVVRGRLASSVKETTLAMTDFVGVVPEKMSFGARGALVNLSAYAEAENAAAVRILKERKIERLRAVQNLDWNWDAKAGHAMLTSEFDAERFAGFKMSLAVAGVEAEKMEAARKSGAPADFVSFGALQSFSLRIEDRSMLDTLFALTAARSGQAPEELRRQIPEDARRLAAAAEGLDPRYGQAVTAVSEFLAKGGALEITASPAVPVAFADLGADGPADLARHIDLAARHEAPRRRR